MHQYKHVLAKIMEFGNTRDDRTKTGTKSLFAEKMTFDLQKGFPLVTIKKTNVNNIIHELLWFLSGSTNVMDLQKNGVKIWDDNEEAWKKSGKQSEKGDLGEIYGQQWRKWPKQAFEATLKCERMGKSAASVNITTKCIDQIGMLVDGLQTNPFSRRHIVSAWNVGSLSNMALEPCHVMFQMYVREENGQKHLDMQLYQRSGDMFLGVPYNIASYALLLHMLAQVTNMKAGIFTHTLGDAHIYSNHMDQVWKILNRKPKKLCALKLNPKITDIFAFTINDIDVVNYDSHGSVYGKMAV